jgi:uncharacterized membrane protein required for colicin V production
MGFIFDVIILLIIVISVLSYAKRGLMGAILDIAGFLLAVIASWIFSPHLGKVLGKFIPSDGSVNMPKIIAFVVLFVVMTLVVSVIKKLARNVKLPIISKVDRILGGVFGLLLGLAWAYVVSVVMCVLITVISAVFPQIGSLNDSMAVTKWFYGLGIFRL